MIRNSFSRGRRHSRKKIAARKFVKPMLEILEDRLAPATVSLAFTDAGLHGQHDVAGDHHGDAPSANTLDIAITGTTTRSPLAAVQARTSS